MKAAIFAAVSVLSLVTAAQTQMPSTGTVPVTIDNFIRAETDLYFSGVALKEGGFGKFEHHRELASIDAQNIIRMNRDTLYSAVVVDLDAGRSRSRCRTPASVSCPCRSLMRINTLTRCMHLPNARSPGSKSERAT